MSVKISGSKYAAMYGPTVGDKVRLADTSLVIEVEKDYTTYGDEVKFGGGKSIRDGMGQSVKTCSRGRPFQRPFRRAGCRVPRERLDQLRGGTSVQDNGRDRKEQCLYVFQPDFSDYCHLSDPCRFVPGSYVSAGHHREHADRHCTGNQGEKDAGKAVCFKRAEGYCDP